MPSKRADCRPCFCKSLGRGAEARRLPRPRVKSVFDYPNLCVRDRTDIDQLREALAAKPVGALVQASLPRMAGLRKVEARTVRGRHQPMPCELIAVVPGDRNRLNVRIA